MVNLSRFLFTVLGIMFRHPVTGATIIPILSNGEIVLIRRGDSGQWGLPGGIIDWGEQVATTAERELWEETGLALVTSPRLIGVYSQRDRDPRLHSISILVAAEVTGTLQANDHSEVLDVKAFSQDTLPFSGLAHDHNRQLQDFLAGKITLA